ncbi:Cyanophycin synthetase [Planctopirus ephydatiae]|uniref:Cyanophycin synthetase n=1 Tax=Planctopirus ephydatiae TaxID=2528019 RepID=A0A518GSB5_9PLAN|nr:cyanophycin synthetase [Planctopirus ephydatiae]QDV31486.1 Cyanophycin synthetase [Planctopirus ephydatiae]
MELANVRALRGPNVWSQLTVIEATLDLRQVTMQFPLELAKFRGQLTEMVAFLAQEDETEVFSQAQQDRSILLGVAEVVVRLVVGLQNAAGSFVTLGRVVETRETGLFRIAFEYCEEDVGRQALKDALRLSRHALALENLLPGHAPELAISASGMVDELRTLDQQIRLGPSTNSIVMAAVARGIPFRRLNTRSLVQLGYGCKQHRILAAETDRTSAVAEAIVQDKELTKNLLEAVGVPVPKGRQVVDAEDAWAAALEIGLPVVIKPKDGNQGRGVAVNLSSKEQVFSAFAAAREEGREILVEKFAPGSDYRLLIIGYKLVAAARREPPQVVGDGRHTIRELVREVNLDPRRGEDHATPLSKIPLDDIACAVLADQGLIPDSVPAAGQLVLLRRNANLSTGGSAADVTELVHPEVAARVIDAVRMVGLDIAGVDVVASDISRPLEQQGGVIVEINAAPGLRMHLQPSSGQPRSVGEAIVNTMFPPGDDGRVPIVSVTGTNGKTTTTRLMAHIFRQQGKCVGMTCTDGVYIDDRRIDTGDCSGPRSARTVLSNPTVEAAVLETARGGILREGLGFDRCHVAIVTNIGEGDHLGMAGIETAEQLGRVKRVIVENVSPDGHAVLNAEDPITLAMADYCPGKVILFARSGDHPAIKSHLAKGGKAVYTQQNWLVAAEGSWSARVASLNNVPLTFSGLIGFQVDNTMASMAAAWALGIPFETIRSALETFSSDIRKAPARFNVLEAAGATLIIDYGHNSSAIVALLDAINQLPHGRRRIVYTAAGDRRDEDIVRQAQLIASGFDEIVIYEDQCTRGRADGEVIRLMRQGLSQGGRLSSILETRGEMVAIEMCLQRMEPGDLVLIQADQVDEAIQFVQNYISKLPLAVATQANPHRSRKSFEEE